MWLRLSITTCERIRCQLMISFFDPDVTGADEDDGELCRGFLCCHPGCPVFGVWHPAIVLHTRDGLQLGTPIVSDHHFCDRHRRTITAQDLVDDELWSVVQEKFGSTGPAYPSRLHCGLMFFHRDHLDEADMVNLEDL